MERLIRFRADMRRSSPLIALHVVSEDEWATLQRLMGIPHSLYFGEVAGKHSEVTWTVEPREIEVLATDENEIAFFRRLGLSGNISLMDPVQEWIEEHPEEWATDEVPTTTEQQETTTQ